jgi:hypothetical protein
MLLAQAALERAEDIVRRSVRESDVIGRSRPHALGALMPATARGGAVIAAERCRVRLGDALGRTPFGGRYLGLVPSAGIACHPEDGATAATMLAEAEAALAQARAAGGNRVAGRRVDRRGAPRRHRIDRLEMRLETGSGQGSVPALLIDWSRTGMRVATEGTFRADDALRVWLPRPARTSRSSVPLPARVVRIAFPPGRAGRIELGLALDASLSTDLLEAVP